VYANEQLGPCFSCFSPFFSVVQLWNYTKTIIRLRLAEYCGIILSTSSRGLCTIQFQNRPSPRAIPGHLTRVKLRVQWGIWPKMRPARWGTWLSCQKVCQRSETKRLRNSLIQHVSLVHGSLLLSIPRGFFSCCCCFIAFDEGERFLISWVSCEC